MFVLSGSEDLVPDLNEDESRFVDTAPAPGFVVHRYRLRVEGLFARIERWTRVSDGDIHWRSISRDNVQTFYGKDARSRIADPSNLGHVFSWLICESRNDKGNAVVYDYKAEDGVGVDLRLPHERNRGAADDARRTAARYPKRVRYGNRRSLLDAAFRRSPRPLSGAEIDAAEWLFELAPASKSVSIGAASAC